MDKQARAWTKKLYKKSIYKMSEIGILAILKWTRTKYFYNFKVKNKNKNK